MKRLLTLGTLMSLLLITTGNCSSQKSPTRLIVLADMGCEPDEMQQIIHMILCSNELEPVGLIAVTGKYLHPSIKQEYRRVTHPELFHDIIDAYVQVYHNMKIHATGWHTPEYLRSIVCAGQTGYGIEDVGEGKSSDGSRLIVSAMEKEDPRPIWIAVNAGSNTLAQALFDFEKSHTDEELQHAIAKLRVFENGAQDNAGAYICKKYPNIHWIRSNYQTYAYGGPKSPRDSKELIIGPHYCGDYEYSYIGQNERLTEHVMKGHGSLGSIFPERRWGEHFGFMEGGTKRLFLWGDLHYVKLFSQGSHLYDATGFEFNEPLYFKMNGSKHDAEFTELLNPDYKYYNYEFERYWHYYQLMGRVAYNPETSSDTWEKEFTNRFGNKAGALLMEGIHKASKILPRIVTASYLSVVMIYNRSFSRFEAEIPAIFFDGKYDVMYFIEALDTKGNGGMYPDLEVKNPML